MARIICLGLDQGSGGPASNADSAETLLFNSALRLCRPRGVAAVAGQTTSLADAAWKKVASADATLFSGRAG